jgi:hypothetical protein
MLRKSSTVNATFRIIALLLVGAVLSACGGGEDSGTTPPPGTVAPSNLSYPSPQTLIAGQAATPINPTVTGTVTSFSVSPVLPAGLVLNTGTGQITGTPSAVVAQASYIITAANSAGSTTFSFAVAVNPAAPTALTYASPQTLTVGTALVVPLRPTVTGTVSSYTVQPALPAGLLFNGGTGEISGTPAAAASSATYIITARNVAGTTTIRRRRVAVNAATRSPTSTACTITMQASETPIPLRATGSPAWFRVRPMAATSTRLASSSDSQTNGQFLPMRRVRKKSPA